MERQLLGRTSSISLDQANKKSYITTNDMIWTQLKRDTPKIIESFDKHYKKEIDKLSDLYGKASGQIMIGHREGDEAQKEYSTVLLNTLTTYLGAISLLREGHRLQPLILMRTIIESISLVIHLVIKPNDLEKYKNNSLKSPKCITTAKTVIPQIGDIYGHLSNNVIHISGLHKVFNPLSTYEPNDQAVMVNLGYLRISIWLFYIAAELAFFDLILNPRYWKKISSDKIQLSVTEEDDKWLRDFFDVLEDIDSK